MAYSGNGSMPYESASKLGHLPIIKNEFISTIIKEFESDKINLEDLDFSSSYSSIIELKEPKINSVIAIDGSYSSITNPLNQKKSISFIKVATLMISLDKLKKAQAPIVNPKLLNEIITQYSDTLATVLPLNNIRIKNLTPLDTIRRIVNITLKVENIILYDTLKFLVYRKWDSDPNVVLKFNCPLCEKQNEFFKEFDTENCSDCGKEIYFTDYISLHMDFYEDNTNESIAANLMQVMEHLLLLSYVRILFNEGKNKLSKVLLLKDGPLSLHSQFSRLVEPIREFLDFIKQKEVELYLVGIEKSGAFFEHSLLLEKKLKKKGEFLIPNNKYIFSQIKNGDSDTTSYGERVNYGSKAFIKIDDKSIVVASIPTGKYIENPVKEDMMGIEEIIRMLCELKSSQFQNALLPIVAVNKLASMSVYPTNNILQKFSQSLMKESSL
ncbi:hypothetical protein F4694_005671 [Bacillus niacini]|uniref:NurA domain-containing protein n=1 Tax=Neobacillus niacini TaxID=86668 RepID=A0A852TKV4_9BACI|nr:hypothetical protein [Neobacillus niacini]NYE08815.1 hypothetical protein [Neobacillus niacini]